MKLNFFLRTILLLAIQAGTIESKITIESKSDHYSWAIVGAGLAGITALAVLIESGVEPSTIAWIDPEFNVGRVGKYYRNVPGNIPVHRLILYVNNCPYFKDVNSSALEALYTYNQEEFKQLHVIADPLMDFTTYLCDKVIPIKGVINSLDHCNDLWALQSNERTILAEKVILAIGAQPKSLNYTIPEIPLDDALDKDKLANYISPDDTIAVFGGMHSAILILKYLSEYSVKEIINFYIDPYFYDAPGLEGDTAMWAKTVLEQNPPANLSRVVSTVESRERLLPICTKAIYAIGYEPESIIVNGTSHITFDEDTGMIDENLYGIGIAFPPTGIVNGHTIAKNGLHAYLAYAKKLIPQWIANERYSTYSHEKDTIQELPWI